MVVEGALTPQEVLALLPQQPPFRFLDEILEVDQTRVVARYTFKHDEFFYQGHFPGNPVTPGVILLEAMGQAGVVALGLYLLSLEVERSEIKNYLSLFTDAEVDFAGMVKPGDRVTIEAEKVFWRRRKLRANVKMTKDDGTLAASATVAGMGVKRD